MTPTSKMTYMIIFKKELPLIFGTEISWKMRLLIFKTKTFFKNKNCNVYLPGATMHGCSCFSSTALRSKVSRI